MQANDRKFSASLADYTPNTNWCGAVPLYVIYGWDPGSFYTAVLCNDLAQAVLTSHPSNRWTEISACVKWLRFRAPTECFGTIEKVTAWMKLTDDERRKKCEEIGLIDTMWDKLKDPA